MGYISNVIEDVDGSIVGYIYVDKEGLTKAICSKALYQRDIIEDLTSLESGYKYYSYDYPDTVTDSNGVKISELPRIPQSTLDEIQTVSFKTSLQKIVSPSQITDAEFAAKYKTFTETSFIEFKEGDYTIHTRKDFIAYLEHIRTACAINSPGINVPLNYLVAPEARFTLEELTMGKDECKKYLPIMLNRHKFRNYDDYMGLVEWLNEQGVLKTKTPTMVEFLQAYNAWGPEGINAKCSNVKGEINVDGDMFSQLSAPRTFETDSAANDYVYQNRRHVSTIVDGNLVVRYLREKNEIGSRISVAEFGRDNLAPTRDDVISTLKRSAGTGHKYKVLKRASFDRFNLRNSEDRFTMELVDENGFSYVYIQSPTKVFFKRNSAGEKLLISDYNFGISYLLEPNRYINLAYIKSKDDYILWNYAAYTLKRLTINSTVEADIRSSSDMLRDAGISPRSIVGYVTNYIERHMHLDKYRDVYERIMNVSNIIYEASLCPIPDWLYDSFLLEPEEPMGIKEFIEAADIDDLLDRHQAMLDNELRPGDTGYDDHMYVIQARTTTADDQNDTKTITPAGFDPLQDSLGYYMILKLMYDCLYGTVDIGCFADGKVLDLQENANDYIDIFMSLVYAEFGDTPDVDAAISYLDSIENNMSVALDDITYTKNNAYHGALIDKAMLAKCMVAPDTWWTYINRTYREVSNAPVSKQRPYLCECISLNPFDKNDRVLMDTLTDIIEYTINSSDIDNKAFNMTDEEDNVYSMRSCFASYARMFASRIFFLILGKQITVQEGEEAAHKTIEFNGITLDVSIPAELIEDINAINIPRHTLYMTLSELCNNEYDVRRAIFLHHIVNANIDPWNIKPKKGFKIRELPLLLNWFDGDQIVQAQGEEFYNAAVSANAIKGSLKAIIDPNSMAQDYGVFISSTTEEDPDYYRYHVYEELSSATDPSYFNYILDYYNPSGESSRISELIQDYILRWNLTKKQAVKMGKQLYSIPLLQDCRERAIASLFCEEVPEAEPVFVDKLEEPSSFLKDYTVPVLQYSSDASKAITLKHLRISRLYTFNDAIKNIDRFKALLNNTYQIVNEARMTRLAVKFITGSSVKTIPLNFLTQEVIQQFISNKILTEIEPNKYLIYASNGVHIIEEEDV